MLASLATLGQPAETISSISRLLEMPATGADLPPEIIHRMMDFITSISLHGRPDHCATYNKRVLGNLSLVCRHWAQLARCWIFATLTVRTGQDIDQLLTFVQFPYWGHHLAIGRYLMILTLEQNTAEPPWIHRVLMARKTYLKHVQVALKIQGEDSLDKVNSAETVRPRPFRTILPQLPRALPHSLLKFTNGITIRDVTFRHPGDLNALMQSTRRVDPYMSISSRPTCNEYWGFIHCRFADHIPTPIRAVFAPYTVFQFVHCPKPWIFLRALLLQRLPQAGAATAVDSDLVSPFVAPRTLESMERLFEVLVHYCPVHRAELGKEVHEHERCTRSCECFVRRDRNSIGWFTVGLGSWCHESAIDVLSIRVSPTGSFGNLELFLDKSNDAVLAPWAQLDDILADLGDETPTVAIHQHRHGSKSLFVADVKSIQERMPRLSRVVKIQFYVCREGSGEYVEVDSDALQDKLVG